MTDRPSDTAVAAWARLARAHRAVSETVEGDLKVAGLPPLAWYDVLLELSRGGDRSATPRELERECLVEQYNLSRLLDRMQAQGLVRRVPFPGDKRRQLVEITDEGRALRKRMWPVYAGALQRGLGDRLSDAEAERLGELLGRLYARQDDESCAG